MIVIVNNLKLKLDFLLHRQMLPVSPILMYEFCFVYHATVQVCCNILVTWIYSFVLVNYILYCYISCNRAGLQICMIVTMSLYCYIWQPCRLHYYILYCYISCNRAGLQICMIVTMSLYCYIWQPCRLHYEYIVLVTCKIQR